MEKTHALSDDLYHIANDEVDQKLMELMSQQDKNPCPTDSSKPRISLVVGPSPFTMPRGWEFFLTAPYEGITYISTVLFNAGYPVRIIDVRYVKDPLQTCYDEIMEGTDVLGVATFEDNFPFVKQLIDKVKETNPEMPVICGGSLVTSAAKTFFEYTKLDVAVISEGELTFLELMDYFTKNDLNIKDSLSNIKGIWYRNGKNEVITNKPRGQMSNLDCLPRMRLDLWPQYKSEMGLQPQIIASYSRGCKMDCSFCYRTTPIVATKSLKKFDEDMKWLKEKYNIEFIMFTDLTFTSIKEQTIEICNIIKKYDIKWACLTRCADVDAERLKAMKESGCDIILYGVESLDVSALQLCRKGSSENITLKALELTKESGIRFGALLIVGLPGETEESLDHMAEFAERHRNVTRVKYLSLLPGTPYYKENLMKGLLKSEVDHLYWLSIEQALNNDEFINVTQLNEKKLRDTYKRVYDSYCPGPVMNFKHFPEYFNYYDPNPDNGSKENIDYAGLNWRKEFSSAGPFLIPGSENHTLDKHGKKEMMEKGTLLMESGAKKLLKSNDSEIELEK